MRFFPFIVLSPHAIICLFVLWLMAMATAPGLLADMSMHKSLAENALDFFLAVPGLLFIACLLHRTRAFTGLRRLAHFLRF